MMKKLIVSLASLSLLTLGLAVTCNNTFAIAADEKGKITADASEFQYVSPDTATISFSVETTDKNSQKAVEINNQKMTKIISVVKGLLTDKESVKTSSYNVHQNYEYNNVLKKSVISGYTVNNTLTVVLKDTSKVGKLIEYATQNGATGVNSMSFTVQNTAGVCKELTAKAAMKAKKEAEQVLAPLGKTIDSIYSVNYGCGVQGNYSPRRYMMAMDAASNAKGTASAPVSIEEGETKVTANVTIVFTIK